MLTEVSWSATRTKETFYSERYHKLAARRGKKRALIAVGHSILKSVWSILSTKAQYKELGADYLKKRSSAARARYLTKELQSMGYEVKQIEEGDAKEDVSTQQMRI